MNNNRIKQLQDEIKSERSRMKNCKHDFGKPSYNPDTKREGYGSTMVGQGSDIWYEFSGYKDVKVDRWTRVCQSCGFEEHTNKQAPVISSYEPDFK